MSYVNVLILMMNSHMFFSNNTYSIIQPINDRNIEQNFSSISIIC